MYLFSCRILQKEVYLQYEYKNVHFSKFRSIRYQNLTSIGSPPKRRIQKGHCVRGSNAKSVTVLLKLKNTNADVKNSWFM